jgi:para-nitrobenzyl esterase
VPPSLASNGFPLGAYHGSELQYLYGPSFLPGPQTDAQKKLSHDMIAYWGNFVKTGNPNGTALTHWPRYDARTQRILTLAPAGNSVIDNFDEEHHCAFWQAHPQSVKR